MSSVLITEEEKHKLHDAHDIHQTIAGKCVLSVD